MSVALVVPVTLNVTSVWWFQDELCCKFFGSSWLQVCVSAVFLVGLEFGQLETAFGV